MLIVSDTNILSSLAAGDALSLLFQLFPHTVIKIPPTVRQELQAGIERNRTHLQTVLDALEEGKLQVVALTKIEQTQIQPLPSKLNLGEREAIVLTQSRNGRLLCNDIRAIRYCQSKRITVFDLAEILRLFWTSDLVSRLEVQNIIAQMGQVEGLVLSKTDHDKIFAKSRRKHRRRNS